MATSIAVTRVNSDCCSLCRRSHISENKLGLCIDCNSLYCESCWPRIPAHNDAGYRWRGGGHEKIDPNIQRRLDHVFNARYTDDQLDELHKADLASIWFGAYLAMRNEKREMIAHVDQRSWQGERR